MTGAVGPIDQSYIEVARCILEDVEQAVTGGEIPEYEALRRLDRHTGGGLTSTHNWTENYDVFLRRCEAMSILKVNVLQVPCHGNQNMCKLGMRLFSTSLFILVYEDGRELLKKCWNAPVTRFHVDN